MVGGCEQRICAPFSGKCANPYSWVNVTVVLHSLELSVVNVVVIGRSHTLGFYTHHASFTQSNNPNPLKEWGKIRVNEFELPFKKKPLKKDKNLKLSKRKNIFITKNKKKKIGATSNNNNKGLLAIPQ